MDNILEVQPEISDSDELHRAPSLKEDNKKNDLDRIPIWPPIAADIPTGLQHALRPGGDVDWFHKILTSLLAISKDDQETSADEEEIEDENSERSNGQSSNKIKSIIPYPKNVIERTWGHVQHQFDHLMDKLESLVITEKNANKIWPITVGWLLWTMKLRKAIAAKPTEEFLIPSTHVLISKYVSHMFWDRMQDEDYVTPKSCRYKGNQFPNIAEDLELSFKVRPGTDLMQILFALFVYLKIKANSVITKTDNFPAINSWLNFLLIAGENKEELFSSIKPTELIIARYLKDRDDDFSGEVIASAVRELSAVTWEVHPGYRDMAILNKISSSKEQLAAIENHLLDLSAHILGNLKMFKMRIDSGKKIFYSLGKAAEYCTVSGCPKSFVVDPAKQKLKYNLPVICDGCGSVLVPEQLFTMYTKERNVDLP